MYEKKIAELKLQIKGLWKEVHRLQKITMKVIKARIYIEQDATGTRYIGYPQAWLDNKERIPTIMYPKDRSDQGTDENGLYQIVFAVVPDDLATTLIKEGLELADPVELQAYTNKHWPKTQRVNEDVVLPILAKAARDEPLTQADKNALDPTHPAHGITMAKDFVELAQEHGAVI